jgi:type I site-specific restriction endonuclease
MDITDADLPDRRLTELGKKMEEEEKADESINDTTASTMIPIEQYQEKTDEIERLEDLLEKDKESLEKLQKQVSDLHEAVKIAE